MTTQRSDTLAEQLAQDAEKALRASEQALLEFKTAVEQSADGIALTDLNGYVRFVNDAWARMHGSSVDEPIGQHLGIFHTKEQLEMEVIPFTERVLAGGSGEGDVGHVRKDGTTFTASMVVTLLTGADRTPFGFIATIRDVSERKALEKALKEKERTVRGILDESLHFVGLLTPDGMFVDGNRTALEFAGIKLSDILGKPFWETPWWTHSSELQERLRQAIQRAGQGETSRMEVMLAAADGSLHWVDFSLKPVKDEAGEVAFLIPEARDITEQKHVAEALRVSQMHYKTLFDASSDAILLRSPDRTVISANRAAVVLFGYHDEEELKSSTPANLYAEYQPDGSLSSDKAPRMAEIALRDGSYSFEWKYRRKDGTEFLANVLWTKMELEGKPILLTTVRDITQQKQAEEDQAKAAAEIQYLYDNAPCGYHSIDADGVIVRINDTELSLLGYSREEIVGKKNFGDLLTTESLKVFKREFPDLKERGSVSDIEFDMVRKDGTLMPVLTNAAAIRDSAHNFLVGYTSIFDITDRRRAELELRKLTVAVEQSPSIIVITDLQGCIEYVNPQFTKLTGYTLDEARGQNPRILKSGRTPPEEYDRLWKTILSGHQWRGEFYNKKKNGDYYWEQAVIGPVTNADGVCINFIAVKEDITERKLIEQDAREAKELLRKSEEKYRILFESSRYAIMSIEPPSWKYTSANPAALKLFGVKTEEEFMCCEPWKLSPERQPDGRASDEKAKEMIEEAVCEGSNFFEWTHKRITGD